MSRRIVVLAFVLCHAACNGALPGQATTTRSQCSVATDEQTCHCCDGSWRSPRCSPYTGTMTCAYSCERDAGPTDVETTDAKPDTGWCPID